MNHRERKGGGQSFPAVGDKAKLKEGNFWQEGDKGP